MAAVAPGAASHLLHHILHRPLPPPPSYSPLKPLVLLSTVSASFNNIPKCINLVSNPPQRHSTTTTTPLLFTSRSLLFLHTLSLSNARVPPINASLSVEQEPELDEDEDGGREAKGLEVDDFCEEEEEDEDDDDDDGHEKERESEKLDNVGLHSLRVRTNGMQLPSLTVKEKKELASYAHSLGKKLKSQLVGKSGVTANVATSFVETLEANELLKIKIHRTCPGELDDVVKQLEELTGSVVVGKIGRTVIIYRPSPTKLKAEEKKRQSQKIFLRRKQLRARPALPTKEARPRLSGRGRRGRSRV